MTRFLLLALMALAVLVAACNGDGDSNDTSEASPDQAGDESPASPAESGITEAEARAAADALLRVLEEDLPPGWTELPAEEESTEPTPSFPPLETIECNELIAIEDNEPGELVDVEGSTYTSPDEEIEVSFSAEVHESAATSTDSVARAIQVVTDCGEQFEESFLKAVQDELANQTPEAGETPVEITVTDVSIQLIPFAAFGDESAMYRLINSFTVDGQEFATYLDSLGVRVGNVIGSFTYETTIEPPDEAAEEEFAARVEQATRDAAASLDEP